MPSVSSPARCAGHRVAALAAALVAASVVALAAGCGSGDEGTSSGASAGFRGVTLLAGAADAGGPGHVDGPAGQARFQAPSGVAVADDGAVWISETESGRIRRVDPTGRVETVVAHVGDLDIGTDAAGRPLFLHRPGPMAAGRGGAVYVAAEQLVWSDPAPDGSRFGQDERWVVLRLGRDGSVAPVLRSGRARVARGALGLFVDRSGRLLVSDATCGVWRGTPGDGVAEAELLHSPACTLFDGVTSVTTDPQGRVVFSMGRGDVRRLEDDGSVSTLTQGAGSGYGCSGMAYDRRGRLLLNRGGRQLHVLDAQGLQPWAGDALEPGWFDGPAAAARFQRPCGLALDESGDAAYVVDQEGGTLRRIEADGRVSTQAGRARQAAFVDADGMAARFGEYFTLGSGWGGSVVVADASLGLVRQVDADGRVRTLVGQPRRDIPSQGSDGPASQATLLFPRQAVVAGDGSLWIGDHGAVRRLGPDGIVRQIAAVEGVRLMALDANRDVLVSATINITGVPGDQQIPGVWRFAAGAPPGTKPTLVPMHRPAGMLDPLGAPNDLCAANDGALYLSYGHAVMRRAPDGQVSAWAGDVEQAGAVDGVATAARFNSPGGLVCEGSGVYVADSENHTVRHINAERRVRTVLGRAGERGVPSGSVPGLLDRPASLARVPGGIAVATGLGVVIARH